MKNNRNKILLGLTIAAGVPFITSCSEDEKLDMSYDRLFGSTKISVEANDITADVSWSSTPNTEYYVLQLSTDTLFNGCENEAGFDAALIKVYGEDMSITTSKTVVDNLLPDTEYYLRIKSYSTDKESTWSYYDNSGKGKFKTSLEQIFDDVHESHVGIDNISLSWRKGAEVTDIRYFIGGDKDNYKTYTLSEDEIEAGEVVLYDLESSTYYTFEIYNGEIKRGSYSAFTKDMDPGEAKEIVLPTGTDISQEYLDDLARLYTNVTLILQPGAEINWNKRDFSGDASLEGGYTIPDKLSITIKGIDPNNKSVINVNGDSDVVQQTGCIEIEGAHPLISFENIRFEHKGSFYLINEEQRFNIGTLSFINCEMNNFTNAIIRLKGSESKKISNLIFDDCIIRNQGINNYAVFHWNSDAYSVGTFKFINSTIVDAKHSFMDARKSISSNIIIENSTFYNVIGDGRYFLDCQNIAPTISISNTIFAKVNVATNATGVWTSTANSIRISDGANVSYENVYDTQDFVFKSTSKWFTPNFRFQGTAEELFVDAENENLSIKSSAVFENIKNAGDPRWR